MAQLIEEFIYLIIYIENNNNKKYLNDKLTISSFHRKWTPPIYRAIAQLVLPTI